MNLGEIKSVSGEKAQNNHPNQELKTKLQEEGLRQATRVQETQVSLSTANSKALIGVKVLSASFSQTISIGNGKPVFEKPKQKESFFDFEEIAKNVLNFVGGAIKAAKMGGADEAKLTTMFEQATSGVLKGVDMARKDLAGFMNAEIDEGINKSLELIQNGIEKLRSEIFGKPEGEEDNLQVVGESVSYSRTEAGEIHITTKDGDEVSISFEDIRRLELNQQLIDSTQIPLVQPKAKDKADQKSEDEADKQQAEKDTSTSTNTAKAAESDGQNSAAPVDAKNAELGNSPQEASPQENKLNLLQELNYFERSGIAFNIKGELDEDEMTAIADLVGDVKDLAESFFSNDVEAAFNKALQLGFNEQEISGYALQLSKTEQLQVVQTYGTVSHYNDEGEGSQGQQPMKQIKPIADYLKDMMDVMEKSKELLLDDSQFNNLVNGLMSKVKGIKTDDLLEAINQFNSFNQKLQQGLPRAETTGEQGSSSVSEG
ncbi:DUF5610 domain-containing protein [Paraneptunicella aestuarii]|uniref:DUF5610 domain-containing protein n=1 Tax=Paraneptunicella aestuarii TaxID=2831148 RepID=UPI001E637D36|nr:DUF5610 domain-containing protein [Paraneptunicella aestuarii]UAA39360.1 DUF5610 domain-containing protein [Paraneptunicella aestuarii]